MQTVSDLMTRDLVSVNARDIVGDVRDMVLDSGIHCVPVLDDEHHPVGIVTSWDLVEEYAPAESIANAMTDRVLTIGADEPVSQAATTMMTNWVHHLVVTDEAGHVCGILSSFDLLGIVADSE